MALGRGRRRRSISAPQFPIPPEAPVHPPMHHSRSYCYDDPDHHQQGPAVNSGGGGVGQQQQHQQQNKSQGQHQAELAAGMTPYSRIIEKYITSNDNTNYNVGFNKRMDHNPMFGVSALPVEKTWDTKPKPADAVAAE